MNAHKKFDRKIRVTILVVMCIWAFVLSNIFFIQIINHKHYKQLALFGWDKHKTSISKKIIGERGSIFDSNNKEIAQNIRKYSFKVRTENYDQKKIISMFSKEFNKKEEYYLNKLNQNREVIFLEKDIVFRNCKNGLKKVGETEGLWCDSSIVRYYPYKEIVSHITGFVNSENKGQYGIEMQYDKVLKGGEGKMEFEVTPSNKKTLIRKQDADKGKDIHLTLNISYQSILIEEMNKGVLKHNAKSASGIIMNPKTGSILAMGTVPSYDPNEFGSFSDRLYVNRVVTDLYEPGSIFKIIPIAAAIGSSIKWTILAPAPEADSLIALLSTCVAPQGTQTNTLGLGLKNLLS